MPAPHARREREKACALGTQAVRAPSTKCKIREITAKTSNRWIKPPATWNTVKPAIQAINRTKNSMVQTLIAISLIKSANATEMKRSTQELHLSPLRSTRDSRTCEINYFVQPSTRTALGSGSPMQFEGEKKFPDFYPECCIAVASPQSHTGRVVKKREPGTSSAFLLTIGMVGIFVLAGLVTLVWRFFTFGKAF